MANQRQIGQQSLNRTPAPFYPTPTGQAPPGPQQPPSMLHNLFSGISHIGSWLGSGMNNLGANIGSAFKAGPNPQPQLPPTPQNGQVLPNQSFYPTPTGQPISNPPSILNPQISDNYITAGQPLPGTDQQGVNKFIQSGGGGSQGGSPWVDTNPATAKLDPQGRAPGQPGYSIPPPPPPPNLNPGIATISQTGGGGPSPTTSSSNIIAPTVSAPGSNMQVASGSYGGASGLGSHNPWPDTFGNVGESDDEKRKRWMALNPNQQQALTQNPTGGYSSLTQPMGGSPTIPPATVNNPPQPQTLADQSGGAATPPPKPNQYGKSAELMQAESDYANSLKMPQNMIDLQNQITTQKASERQGIENVREQPIAMPFISGQTAAIERQGALEAQTLNERMANMQAIRQSSLDASKYALGLQEDQFKMFNEPRVLGYGGSVVMPSTGQTIGGFGGNTTDALSKALQDGRITSDMISRYGIPFLADALSKNPTLDLVHNKAAAEALITSAKSKEEYIQNPDGSYSLRAAPGVAGIAGAPPISSGSIQTPNATSGGLTRDNQGNVYDAQGQKIPNVADPRIPKDAQGNPTINLQNLPMKGGSNIKPGFNGSGAFSTNAMGQNNIPNQLPPAKTKAQNDFNVSISDVNGPVNAQNTAIGHLAAAYELSKAMDNWSLQPANRGKNFWNSETGKAAVNNYNLAHQLSSSELSKAYGTDTGGERQLTAAIGSSNSSPAQLKGFVQTSAELLSSKILSNIQQFKTTYGQNAPLNLNWFISPQNVSKMAGIGIFIKQSGNEVGVYNSSGKRVN